MNELMTRRANAVDLLWRTLGKITEVTTTAVTLNDLCTNKELNHTLSTSGSGSQGAKNIFHMFADCRKKSPLDTPTIELLESPDIRAIRPFVSDRLWSLFFVLRGVHFRLMILAGWSFDKQKYIDWRDDEIIDTLLFQTLPKEVIEHGKNKKLGGLMDVIFPSIENDFMAEARRVLKGDVTGDGMKYLPEVRPIGFDFGDQ